MDKQVTALTMGAALLISVVAGTLAWHHMGRPDNWYKACALGLMGGIAGAVPGLILAFMTESEPVLVSLSFAAVMGALMTYRYIDQI